MTESRPFLTQSQVAEIIGRFETEHCLFGYAVKGVSVWQILRFDVAVNLQNLPLDRQPSRRTRKVTLLWKSLKGIANIASLALAGRKSRYWVNTYDFALRLRVGGQYEDIYFDALLRHIPGGLKIQSSNAIGYEVQKKRESIKPQLDSGDIDVLSHLLAKVAPVKKDNGIFRLIAQLISSRLELGQYDEKTVRRAFSSYYWRSQCYGFLLRRLKPKAVLVADTGEFPLRAACRKEKVVFIEIQHGIYTKNHPDALPMNALEFESNLLLPTYLAVAGEYWQQMLAGTAIAESSRIRFGGFSIVDYYRNIRARSIVPNPGCLVITLTTQGHDSENLVNLIRDFLGVCDSGFTLNIKLHPAYDYSTEVYVEALSKDARVNIVSGTSDPNTYELIARSDLHLSIYSVCHFDALSLGVPTVVIGLSGYQVMEDLIRRGDSVLAMTSTELSDIVKTRRWKPVNKETMEMYCMSNFVENIAKLF